MVAYPFNSQTAAAPATPPVMNLDLPVRTASKRNDESRNSFFSQRTPSSSLEALTTPVKDVLPMNDKLIVGVDFGTTYSG